MTTRTKACPVLAALLLASLAARPAIGAENLTPAETEALVAPLLPDDPRAQVARELLGVPEAPVPPENRTRRVSARRAKRGLVHDLESGRTRGERRRKRGAEADAALRSDDHRGRAVSEVTAAEEPVALSPRVVWGSDDRVRITPTTSYPWRAHTKLFVTFRRNGVEKTYGCSGTLIAPKYLITAGHCVHSVEAGGWAVRVEAVPGYDNGYRPYGSAFATRLRSVTGWTSAQDPRHDWALVTLDRSIGSTVGWFGYGAFSDTTLNTSSANVAGYPGDKCGGQCLYYDVDPFSRLTSLTTHYRTDTFNGQSGSGVYVIQNGSRYVAAAHRGTCSAVDSGSNCGPRITGDRFSQIQSWIASGL